MDSDVTVEFLKQLWTSQDGRCPLTGWNMFLPTNGTLGFPETKPENASLDRINNDRGYVRGNVRFVCLMANLARSRFSDKDLIWFCRSVAGRFNEE